MNMGEKKIFAIDDEPEILEFLKATIESMGCQFVSATNALDSLSKIEIEKPDLLFVDVMLPDMDGITLCQRIKSNPKTKDIPIIVFSSLTDSVTVQESLLHGSIGFIPKPFDHDLIKKKVEEIFNKTSSK